MDAGELTRLGIDAKVFLERVGDLMRVWETRRALNSSVLINEGRDALSLGHIHESAKMSAMLQNIETLMRENEQYAAMIETLAEENQQLRSEMVEMRSISDVNVKSDVESGDEGRTVPSITIPPNEMYDAFFQAGRDKDIEYFKQKIDSLTSQIKLEEQQLVLRQFVVDHVL